MLTRDFSDMMDFQVVVLSVMYYAREPGKIKYALFPFKSIIGGKYIFKKVMILNKMKILLICIKYPPTS